MEIGLNKWAKVLTAKGAGKSSSGTKRRSRLFLWMIVL
jgi:hypothetical protein